jgi:hypothetical protein
MADPFEANILAQLMGYSPPPSISPQDYLMMLSMGFAPGAVATGGNISSGPFSGSYKQFSDGARTSEMGDARVNIPLAAGSVGLGAGVQRDVGQGYSATPGATASVGPLSANYNRTYGTMSSGGGESYGAAVKVGDAARLSYQRTRPGNGLPSSDAYGVGVPVAGGGLDFSTTRGGVGGSRYRAGLTLADILGGELAAALSYVPNNRDVSAQAKFRKEF